MDEIYLLPTVPACLTLRSIIKTTDFNRAVYLSVCSGSSCVPAGFETRCKIHRGGEKCSEMDPEELGEDASKYTIVLFTHADTLKGKPVELYINKSKDLLQLIQTCYGRYHSFNNENRVDRDQVTELLKIIDKMVNFNGMKPYTNSMYNAAQEKIRKEQMLTEAGKRRLAAAGEAAAGVVAAGAKVAATACSAVEAAAEAGAEAAKKYLDD